MPFIRLNGKKGKKCLVNSNNVTAIFKDGEGCEFYMSAPDYVVPVNENLDEIYEIIKTAGTYNEKGIMPFVRFNHKNGKECIINMDNIDAVYKENEYCEIYYCSHCIKVKETFDEISEIIKVAETCNEKWCMSFVKLNYKNGKEIIINADNVEDIFNWDANSGSDIFFRASFSIEVKETLDEINEIIKVAETYNENGSMPFVKLHHKNGKECLINGNNVNEIFIEGENCEIYMSASDRFLPVKETLDEINEIVKVTTYNDKGNTPFVKLHHAKGNECFINSDNITDILKEGEGCKIYTYSPDYYTRVKETLDEISEIIKITDN